MAEISILNQVARDTGAEAGSVYLLSNDNTRIEISEAVGPVAGQVLGRSFEVGQGLAGAVAQSGESFNSTAIQSDPRHFQGIDNETGFVSKSALQVPIQTTTGQVIGVIQLLKTTQDQAFSPSDQKLLELGARALRTEIAYSLERPKFEIASPYLHPELLRAIAKDDLSMLKHGKITTGAVLFSDIADYTRLTTLLGSAAVAGALNSCFQNLVPIVTEQFGGVIDSYPGDAILAVFLPDPTMNHPAIRAAAAGQQLCLAFQSWKDGSDLRDISSLNLRVGADFGEIYIGPVGTDKDRRFTVIGEPVNSAKLAQENAGLGMVNLGAELLHAIKSTLG